MSANLFETESAHLRRQNEALRDAAAESACVEDEERGGCEAWPPLPELKPVEPPLTWTGGLP